MVNQEGKYCHFRFIAYSKQVGEVLDFDRDGIVFRKGIAKSTYGIKNRFMKTMLF